jgi:putative heme iron utilization protein
MSEKVLTHQKQCLAFFQSRSTLILSTSDSQGALETSVAPFVTDDMGYLYIFVSELAQHTQNILQLITAKEVASSSDGALLKLPGLVSCLLMADETQTEQLFARERLTIQLDLAEIPRAAPQFDLIMTRFESRFGDVISLLKGLPDFHLIQLSPLTGGYIKGFGQAFSFVGCPCQEIQPVKRQ